MIDSDTRVDDWNRLSRFYDDEYTHDDDVIFYQSLVAGRSAEVLELASGTGRCFVPFAHSGYRVTGVDFAPDMIVRANERLERETPEVRERVTLVNADITTLALGRTFDLVFIACNSLLLIADFRKQEEVIRAAYQHLNPGGLFAVGISSPDIHRDNPKFPVVKHAGSWTDGASGHAIDVFEYNYYDEANQILYGVKMYDEIGENNVVYRTSHNYEMRFFCVQELRVVLERCGFRVRHIYGDYKQGPYTIDSGDIVAVAERP